MAKKKEDDRPEIKEEADAQVAYEKVSATASTTKRDGTSDPSPGTEPALPAELPEPEPDPAPAPELVGTSPHPDEDDTYKMTPAPPEYGLGALVVDALEMRSYYLLVGEKRYVHVAEMPDGRWIYRPD